MLNGDVLGYVGLYRLMYDHIIGYYGLISSYSSFIGLCTIIQDTMGYIVLLRIV